jgi:hypothetical protein
MKPRLVIAFSLGLVLAPFASALSPIDTKVLQRTQAKIDALFKGRNTPVPINPRHNPFRLGDDPLPPTTLRPNAEEGETTEASSDEALLARAAALLKIAGVLEVGGRTRLSINQANYAVGDRVQLRMGDLTVEVRIVAINPRSVVLGYNSAELTLRF